ncbi:alpha/beta fold hydrolase [Streptomyces griseorubiginosus]|uniref:alpha/beta fold hydrolase n=1 Tax=Streptomyces griseorubiginosus TaxID=67304 RepID=UPI003F517C14
MTAVHVTVWDDRNGGGADTPALFVHNIFTWGDDPEYGFAGQRPLTADRPLLLMDRRGYGDSPDTARSDFEVDAEDVVGLLGTGAHLVGHGNGGVVALLDRVRGLTPTVTDDATPERFLRESTESVGLPVPPLRCGFG